MIYEKVISGKLVLQDEIFNGQIGIDNGKIVKIANENDVLRGHIEENFKNKLILPGAIDVHVHCFSNPNEGFEKTSRLAARGGVTTFLDMPYDLPNPINNTSIFKEKIEALEEKSLVDIGLWGTISKQNGTKNIEPLVEAGAMSFKMSTFETDKYRFPKISNSDIIKSMEILSEKGILVAFHSEDDQIVKNMVSEYQESGKVDNISHNETRPPYTETTAVLKLLEFAYWTGAKLHIVHVSHYRTLNLIKMFKDMGVDVTSETCYPYLLLDTKDLKKYGPRAKMNPPLRDYENSEKLWEHLKEGNIDIISSDHIKWEVEEKNKGNNNIFNSPSGLPGLEIIVPLIFNSMVHEKGFSPIEFAKVMSSNAAARFQINGKGKIEVGYDADFIVIDSEKEWELNENTIETDIRLLPFEGLKIKGKIVETIIRGETVFDGKDIKVNHGYGKFIEGSGVL